MLFYSYIYTTKNNLLNLANNCNNAIVNVFHIVKVFYQTCLQM